MQALIRASFVLLLVVFLASGFSGCTQGDTQPGSPDLKVPDVPPGGHGGKKMPDKKNAK